MKILFLWLFLLLSQHVQSFIVSPQCQEAMNKASLGRSCSGFDCRGGAIASAGSSTARHLLINPAILSVLSGSVAGAVGVGVAFPFDTLKTKAQVINTRSDTAAMSLSSGKIGMLRLIGLIWEREGLAGFFSGVKGMMIGQAVIKAVAFSANSNALVFLQAHEAMQNLPAAVPLLVAACFSGFVTSFLVAPIERIKLMLQAQTVGTYGNELECLQAIVRSEGWYGLMTRGLGTTLIREVPSYGLYFLVYGMMMQTTVAQLIPGPMAPLVFGALSGMASWLPVYPVDVVKTTLQNTDGTGNEKSALEVTRELYRTGGIGAFFDGLDAKMMRAAVNHSVTFFCFELLMDSFGAK